MSDIAQDQSALRILLVDDEPLVRAGTAMMLDELGHDVVEAASAAQGLEALAQEGAFDTIVTDFRMPDMDGGEMVARARQIYPHLKVVVMTGYSSDDPRLAGVSASWLTKPFGLEDLERALSEAV